MQLNYENHNELIIDTYDFYERHIICTREQWIIHVCDPKSDHAFMDDYLADVLDTINTAKAERNEISIDRDYLDRTVLDYQKWNDKYQCYIRVVVKFSDKTRKEGCVITAFMPDGIRPGDTPIIFEGNK